MTNAPQKFDVYAHGIFYGTFDGEDEAGACQAAADEHDTANVGQARASVYVMTAFPHRVDGMRDDEDYDAIFDDLNDRGKGYSPSPDDDADISALEHTLKADLVRKPTADIDIAVYHDRENGRLILVGDAHGPWAVDYYYI